MANCEKCRYRIGCVNYAPKSTTACEHYAEDERNVLKPCPFCGSEAIIKATAPIRNTQMFICGNCGAEVCFYGAEYEPKATEAWNRRADNERKTD